MIDIPEVDIVTIAAISFFSGFGGACGTEIAKTIIESMKKKKN